MTSHQLAERFIRQADDALNHRKILLVASVALGATPSNRAAIRCAGGVGRTTRNQRPGNRPDHPTECENGPHGGLGASSFLVCKRSVTAPSSRR
jgi:hypothetical protein